MRVGGEGEDSAGLLRCCLHLCSNSRALAVSYSVVGGGSISCDTGGSKAENVLRLCRIDQGMPRSQRSIDQSLSPAIYQPFNDFIRN